MTDARLARRAQHVYPEYPQIIPPAPPVQSAGWTTVLDLDFSALPNQALGVDGPVTIGGTGFSKVNSANEAAPTALVHGQGIVIQPSAATDYIASNFTLPGLRWNLAQIPGFAYDVPTRVWMHVTAQNITANFDAADFGIETVNGAGVPVQNVLLKRCFDNGQAWLTADNQDGTNVNQIVDHLHLTDDVYVVEVDAVPILFAKSFTGLFVAGNWPDPSSFFGHTILNPTPVNVSADSAANPFQPIAPTGGTSGWNAFFGAQRSGSATALSITFARLRVDIHP